MNKIHKLEFLCIFFFLTRAAMLGMTTTILMRSSGQDSYLSVLLGIIIGLIPLAIYIYILNYKPDFNIFEKIKYLFKKSNILINTLLVSAALVFASTLFISLCDFVNNQYLYETPLFIISLVFIVPLIYTLTKKTEVILHSNLVLFFISSILILIAFVTLFPQINIDNLKPFFDVEPNGLLKGALYFASYNILSLVVVLAIPKNKVSGLNNKNIVITYFISLLIVFGILINTLTILGPNLTAIFDYPSFYVLKRAELPGFIERIEGIYSIHWILDIYVSILMFGLFFKEFLNSYGFNERVKKKVIIILGILIIGICSLVTINRNSMLEFASNSLLIIILICLLFIPLLISIKIKKSND